MGGIGMKLDWDFSKLLNGLERYDGASQFAAYEAAVDVAHDGLGRMINAAPLLTGFLRGSGQVYVNDTFLGGGGNNVAGSAEGRRPKMTAIVWAFNTHYAAKVHENPSAGRIAGGWKYVSRIMEERHQTWMEFFARRIREAK